MNGTTQAPAAERAGIPVATLCGIEQGESASTENLLRPTRVLGVMDDLTAALGPMSTDRARPRRPARRRVPLAGRT